MEEGHIYIDDVISQDYHKEVKRKIEALSGAKKLVVHLQSPGGSVYGGYNTYHVLKGAGKPIDVIIEGESQSIATFIMLAADKIYARNPSVIMIHNPYQGIEGDADAMESGANELRRIEADMIEAYHKKTKLPKDQIREMMKRQTTMTADEAKQFGFVDEVMDTLRAVAIGKKQTTMKDEVKELFNKVASMFAKASNEIAAPAAPVAPKSAMDEMVGKAIMVDGAPAPDGMFVVQDGVIVKAEEAPAVPLEENKEDEEKMKRISALEAELTALKAEATAKEQTIQALNNEKTEALAKVESNVKMLGELKANFDELKKKTVGDDSAPVMGNGKPVKINNESDSKSWGEQAREELFKEHLAWFTQNKN